MLNTEEQQVLHQGNTENTQKPEEVIPKKEEEEEKDESKVDLEVRERLIRKEEHLMKIQRRAYELAVSSLPHGVFVDPDLTSVFLTDTETDHTGNSRNNGVDTSVGFDLNKASPIFIQFLAWQRLMQVNQQIRIERDIATSSAINGNNSNSNSNSNNNSGSSGNGIDHRVLNLIEMASSGTLKVEHHKDHICNNNKHKQTTTTEN